MYLKHESFPPLHLAFSPSFLYSKKPKVLASHPLGKHPQRLFGFQEKENRREKRKAKRSLYFTKCKIYKSSSPGTSSPTRVF